jgi:hypothetical protein
VVVLDPFADAGIDERRTIPVENAVAVVDAEVRIPEGSPAGVLGWIVTAADPIGNEMRAAISQVCNRFLAKEFVFANATTR